MPQHHVADSGDAQIRYLDSGGDDLGAPVVFVPGFTCVAEDYVEILPLLGRRRYLQDEARRLRREEMK